MNSDSDSDRITTHCKEDEDCIIVTDKPSPKRCKLELEENLHCKLTPGDGHCITNYFAVHFEKKWQCFGQIGRGISHKFIKVWPIFWMKHRENYIKIKQYNNDTAYSYTHMFLYAWGLHFLKFHFKNTQQWGSLVCL